LQSHELIFLQALSIEVGYPGVFPKDHDEMVAIAKHVSQASICGLASSKPTEIAMAITVN